MPRVSNPVPRASAEQAGHSSFRGPFGADARRPRNSCQLVRIALDTHELVAVACQFPMPPQVAYVAGRPQSLTFLLEHAALAGQPVDVALGSQSCAW